MPATEFPPLRLNLAPGPTSLLPGMPDIAQDFLARGWGGLNHRSAEISALTETLVGKLRTYLDLPANWRLYFVSSGSYAMEVVLRNTAFRRCTALSAGAFGQRFATVARRAGRHVDEWQLPAGRSLPSWVAAEGPEALAAQLNSAAWQWAEAWLLCHNETSTGTALPLAMLPPLEETSPLRLVDCVSSAGAQALPWGQLDVAFFGVQKAFGCPPGLAVLAVGPRALAKSRYLEQAGRDTGGWFSFARLEENSQRHQAPSTPNTLGLALLHHAVDALSQQGLAHWEGHCLALRQRCMQWLDGHALLMPAVPHDADRSLTVSALMRRDGASLLPVQHQLRQRGIIVGGGYGEWKERSLRLAHFPAISMDALEECLGALDHALQQSGGTR